MGAYFFFSQTGNDEKGLKKWLRKTLKWLIDKQVMEHF
jgi:hypothetical protein